MDEIVVGRCLGCGSGSVIDLPQRGAEGINDYSSGYEAELDPRKAERCWRLFCEWTGGPAGAGSILDVGCGEGAFLDLAREAGLLTAGVEIAGPAASVAAERGHRIFNCSITDGSIPGDGSFDIVTLWDVLEHLPWPARSLRWVQGALRPGGRLLIVTPMMGSLYDRLGVALHGISGGRFDKLAKLCWNRDHLFRFHPVGVRKVLTRMGFDRVRVAPVLLLSLGADCYAGDRLAESWTRRPWLDRAISRAGVGLARAFGLQNKMIVAATKAETEPPPMGVGPPDGPAAEGRD